MHFVDCRAVAHGSVQLDGGNVASSNTCWTDADSTAQPAVVRSAQSESDLGPTAFSVTLNDRNPAVSLLSSDCMQGALNAAIVWALPEAPVYTCKR